MTGEVIEDGMLNESIISEIDSESSNDSSCNDATFDSDKSENSYTDESSNVSFEKLKLKVKILHTLLNITICIGF